MIEWSDKQFQYSSFYFLIDKFKQFYMPYIIGDCTARDVYDQAVG